MFGSAVLEVATGLVFVFVLVALICSQIGGKVSELFNWRAKGLEAGLRDLILGKYNQDWLHKVYESSYFQQANQTVSPFMVWLLKTPLNRFVFAHIKNGPDSVIGPVSIDGKSFALALLDAITPNASGQTTVDQWRESIKNFPDNMPLKKALLPIAESADKKIDDVQKRIQEWFVHAEDQMTATYKQNMWAFGVLIGLIVSIVFNVDAISIGDGLWRDPALRAVVNEAAAKYELEPGGEAKAQAELEKLNLPIGWQVTSGALQIGSIPIPRIIPNDWATGTHGVTALGWLRDFIAKFIGWLITAVAGAQGAPFWFDILKKLRTASSSSASTETEEQPKS